MKTIAPLLLALSLEALSSPASAQQPDKFIRLVEFQVWSDWRGPEVPACTI